MNILYLHCHDCGRAIQPYGWPVQTPGLMLNLDGPGELEGRSLLPLVRGTCGQLHGAVFTEQNYHGPLEALRAVNDGRYKLILRHDTVGPRMRQDGPSTAVMEAAGYYDRNPGQEELYDLYLDPMEACNRAADPALSEVKAGLRAKLDDWMKKTDDVFSSGAFPKIPGR
jgi:N-sulfoglucosamine sulfohydrolase